MTLTVSYDMFKAINNQGKGAVIFYQSRHASGEFIKPFD
jgi:hypothetical protein